MKTLTILSILALLTACGKTTKTTTKHESFSLEKLQASGIMMYTNSSYLGSKVSIVCSGTAVTNQERLTELTGLKTSMGVGNSNAVSFSVGKVSLNPTEANTLFSQAISAMQRANPSSNECPQTVLSSLY